MDLWKEYQQKKREEEAEEDNIPAMHLSNNMDEVLQILEYYAEDEIFEETDIEAESINKVLNKGQKDSSIKKAVRMSIYTIAEEDDGGGSDNGDITATFGTMKEADYLNGKENE
jgi:hypothetical protein